MLKYDLALAGFKINQLQLNNWQNDYLLKQADGQRSIIGARASGQATTSLNIKTEITEL